MVLTKTFYGFLADIDKSIVSNGETAIFDEADPAQLISDLEKIRHQRITMIHIFDVAVMPGDSTWAFVQDGINRSGSNPLRQFSGLSEMRFIDVGHLYLVPEGQTGITILSLGARFKEVEESKSVICGHLQTAAIVAHTMGFEVTALVVDKKFLKRLSLTEIKGMC